MPEREKKGTAFEIPFEDAAKVCKLILGFTPTGIIYGREQAGDGCTGSWSSSTAFTAA
ncbi:hypothetical protein G7K71_08455 [Desulfofundulus sp. TPOSR]|uniref:hypothetical protein n=1 Tax=Desulfofundulus sp. TPOSR TaxID=2714340 RepID=UPI00140B7F1A|nr:hypothetical protein [Desulfofundulus sp. TPOSR]NHM25425.1 hypothetical protein [Desulfofundulus sp. TPOSR]NHM27014.1 hypothetical protein [Desulfofundulus sp. TPOSR]